MSSLRIFLFGLLLFLIGFALFFKIPGNYERSAEISYYSSPDPNQSIDDILTKTFSPTRGKPVVPASNSIWIRMTIPQNALNWSSGLILFTGSNETALSMQAYLSTNGKTYDLGYCDVRLEAPACPLPSLQYAFPINAAMVSPQSEVFLKILPGGAGINNEFYFMQLNYFNKVSIFLGYFFGTATGLAFLISIISLVFFVSLREYSFLVYCFFYLNFYIAWIVNRGFWDAFRPSKWFAAENLLLPLEIWILIFDIIFLLTYFRMPRRNPRLSSITITFISVLSLIFLGSCFDSLKSFIWQIYPVLDLTGKLFAMGILAYYIQEKRSWVLTIAMAWAVLIIFDFVWVAYIGGLVTGNWFFGYYPILGRCFQIFILSFVLYQRLKSLVSQIFTAKVKLEEDRLTKTLLRTLSHDLSNTTQVIQSSCELALKYSDPDKVRTHLLRISRTIKSQHEIISYSKRSFLVRGGSLITLSSVNLKSCLDEVLDLLDLSIKAKNINIQVEFESNSIHVLAEKMTLTFQVLANLLTNAIKFTPTGKKITIRARNIAPEFVELKVIDEGLGFPKHVIDNILSDEKISRLGTANEPGTGHGLSIAIDFLKAYGARLRIKSDEKKGTEMIVQFKRGN